MSNCFTRTFLLPLSVNDGQGGHRDWRYDELRLSKDGRILHEIEWHGANEVGSWLIEASDVELRWIPL
jgi:hypothetical protein